MIFVRYLLAPTGIDGALEAYLTLPFCCPGCRSVNATIEPFDDVDLKPESADFLEGTYCETCGKEIEPQKPQTFIEIVWDGDSTPSRCTLAEWIEANRESITGSDIQKLLMGETLEFGGGAVPVSRAHMVAIPSLQSPCAMWDRIEKCVKGVL